MKRFYLPLAFLCLVACNRNTYTSDMPLDNTEDTGVDKEKIEDKKDPDVKLSINPVSVSLAVGSTFTFNISASGVDRSKVILSVQEGSSGGTITPAGTFTAPSFAGIFHIIAEYADYSVVAEVRVYSPANFVTAGSDHTCAIWDTKLKCWGSSFLGQMGVGESSTSNKPTAVLFPETASAAAARWDRTCALSTAGNVYCWGLNDLAQSGSGSQEYQLWAPQPVSGGGNILQIALNQWHTCAVTEQLTLLCWGVTNLGSLGTGQASEAFPTEVTRIPNVLKASLGWDHTCALKVNGQVMCWGRDWNGQLGAGVGLGSSEYPVYVTGLTNAVDISVGDEHSCARTIDGKVYCWGANMLGQLGNGTRQDSAFPVQVSGVTAATNIESGVNTTCVIDSGIVKCWGANLYGILGTGSETGPQDCAGNPCSTIPVEGLIGASKLAVGTGHACATNEGLLYCWGNNASGQLGVGDTSEHFAPLPVFE